MKELTRRYKGFLFDLNGTMVDDMKYHIKAWDEMLNGRLRAGLSAAEVKSQMYGKNDELLVRVFGEGRFSPEEMREVSMEKERAYQQAFLPYLKLIDGLDEFLNFARAQLVKLAIGSAAIPFNIDFVIDNLGIRHYFDAIVSAEDVAVSKPHPATYLTCADRLGLQPSECLVFEDAPKGVEAAMNAGMACIALTTLHEASDFKSYPNLLSCISDYRS